MRAENQDKYLIGKKRDRGSTAVPLLLRPPVGQTVLPEALPLNDNEFKEKQGTDRASVALVKWRRLTGPLDTSGH